MPKTKTKKKNELPDATIQTQWLMAALRPRYAVENESLTGLMQQLLANKPQDQENGSAAEDVDNSRS